MHSYCCRSQLQNLLHQFTNQLQDLMGRSLVDSMLGRRLPQTIRLGFLVNGVDWYYLVGCGQLAIQVPPRTDPTTILRRKLSARMAARTIASRWLREPLWGPASTSGSLGKLGNIQAASTCAVSAGIRIPYGPVSLLQKNTFPGCGHP